MAVIHLPVNKDVENLLLWRDPVRSGAVFGAITAAYIVLGWANFSAVSLISNFLLVVVIAAFLWNNIAAFTNKPGVPIPKFIKEGVDEAELKNVATRATTPINKVLAVIYRVLAGKDVVLTAAAASILFVLAKIGSTVSLFTLAYLAVLAAFSVPKLYEMKKPEIDAALKKVTDEIEKNYNKYLKKYVDRIPKASSTRTSPAKGPSAHQAFADATQHFEEVKKDT